MSESYEALKAERDRLRAVVDAVRKTVGGSIQAIEAARAEEMGRDVILRNVSAALTTTYEQLDVSGGYGRPMTDDSAFLKLQAERDRLLLIVHALEDFLRVSAMAVAMGLDARADPAAIEANQRLAGLMSDYLMLSDED